MQVNAICEDGVIRFTQALQFKNRKFHLVIDLPESEIQIASTPAVIPISVDTVDATQTAGSLYLLKIQAILGRQFHPRPQASVDQDRAVYIDALVEKYKR
jgi:hypothetical protein